MWDGLISVQIQSTRQVADMTSAPTTMDDAVDIIQICETLQDSQCHLANDFDVDWAHLLVNAVQGAFIHELHANANVRIGYKCAIERYNAVRMTIVHDLYFSQYLFSDRRFCINENDLNT
jgi:hypothetical protein